MKRALLCLLAILTAAISNVFAQERNVAPASPEFAQLKKFIDMPVDYATGVPDISFPLFTLNTGQLKYPLAIRYHSGGSKPTDKSTWIGMDWDFTGELDISVSRMGAKWSDADVQNEGFSKTKAYLRGLANGEIDEEPDEYQFRLLNHSGKFYMQKMSDGTIKARVVPYVDIKIEKTTGGFEVTDEQGLKYRFGKALDGNTYIEKTYIDGDLNGGGSSFKCTEIISASKKDTIFFEYYNPVNTYSTSYSDRVELSDDAELSNSYSFVLPRQSIYSSDPGGYNNGDYQYYLDPIECYGVQKVSGTSHYSATSITTGTLKLKRAWCRSGEINYYFKTGAYSLDSVVYKNYNGELINKVSFFHSAAYPYMKLDYFTVSGSNRDQTEKYSFDYNGGTLPYFTKTLNPYGLSYETLDPGGYSVVCGVTQPTVKSSLVYAQCQIQEMQIRFSPVQFPIAQNLPGNWYSTVSFEKAPINDRGVLKKITYPTGGYTEFEYSAHYVDDVLTNQDDPSASQIHTKTSVGGLRVTSIKKYDGISSGPVLQQFYKYGLNENDMGYLKVPLNERYYISERRSLYLDITHGDSDSAEQRSRIFSQHPSVQSILGRIGCHVFYPEVAVYNSENGQLSGKTVYAYDTMPGLGQPYFAAPLYKPIIMDYHDFSDRGKLKAVTSYKYYNGNYEWVNKKEYDYIRKTMAPGIWIGKAWCTRKIVNRPDNYVSPTGINVFDNYEEYEYVGGYMNVENSLVSRETEKQRDPANNNELTVSTQYYYDRAHFLPTRIEKSTSTGKVLTTYMTYPPDYAAGNGFTDLLNQNNMIGNPVEKVTVQQDAAGTKIISGQIITYRTDGPDMVDKTYSIETAAPIDLSSFKFSNRTTGLLPVDGAPVTFGMDGHYKEKVTYNSYDAFANPLTITPKDNIATTYLWGYQHNYPVAKIVGADYNTVSSWIDQNILNNPASDQALRTELNKIRINLAGTKIVVNTYTYKPSIGMSSATDANGVTTYYEFDAFGRLMHIRDKDNNILKKYCYNYQGQPTTCGVGNAVQTRNFTKSDCGANQRGSVVTYTVPADKYFALTQPEADALAVNDINANGQNYANTNGSCLPPFYSVAKNGTFTRNNCPSGGTPSTYTYTVPAGSYLSIISQEDADQKAQNDVNSNGQSKANELAVCTFYNLLKSQTFYRNNCPADGTPASYIYTVPAGAYTSTVSQNDADQKALNDISANGQAKANQYGNCNFYSDAINENFYSQNCNGAAALPYPVNLPANYTGSTISKEDANNQARAYAQSQANAFGACAGPSVALNFHNNSGYTVHYVIELYNQNTGDYYYFEVDTDNATLGYVPQGMYDIYITGYDDTRTYSAGCGHSTTGNGTAELYDVPIIQTAYQVCNSIEIN